MGEAFGTHRQFTLSARGALLAASLAAALLTNACTEGRKVPSAVAVSADSIDAAVAQTRIITDSQPNYYAADVTVSVGAAPLPHYTSVIGSTNVSYHLVRQRANATTPWSSQLSATGRQAGRYETNDPAQYRRVYNAAGVLYTPTGATLPSRPSNGPPPPDPVIAFPPAPPGSPAPLSSSASDAAPKAALGASGLGAYIVEAGVRQQLAQAMRAASALQARTSGDTITFHIRRGERWTDVTLSDSTGAELETVTGQGALVLVRARHYYKRIATGELARVKSVISVDPTNANHRRAEVTYSLEHIVYEHRRIEQ